MLVVSSLIWEREHTTQLADFVLCCAKVPGTKVHKTWKLHPLSVHKLIPRCPAVECTHGKQSKKAAPTHTHCIPSHSSHPLSASSPHSSPPKSSPFLLLIPLPPSASPHTTPLPPSSPPTPLPHSSPSLLSLLPPHSSPSSPSFCLPPHSSPSFCFPLSCVVSRNYAMSTVVREYPYIAQLITPTTNWFLCHKCCTTWAAAKQPLAEHTVHTGWCQPSMQAVQCTHKAYLAAPFLCWYQWLTTQWRVSGHAAKDRVMCNTFGYPMAVQNLLCDGM